MSIWEHLKSIGDVFEPVTHYAIDASEYDDLVELHGHPPTPEDVLHPEHETHKPIIKHNNKPHESREQKARNERIRQRKETNERNKEIKKHELENKLLIEEHTKKESFKPIINVGPESNLKYHSPKIITPHVRPIPTRPTYKVEQPPPIRPAYKVEDNEDKKEEHEEKEEDEEVEEDEKKPKSDNYFDNTYFHEYDENKPDSVTKEKLQYYLHKGRFHQRTGVSYSDLAKQAQFAGAVSIHEPL